MGYFYAALMYSVSLLSITGRPSKEISNFHKVNCQANRKLGARSTSRLAKCGSSFVARDITNVMSVEPPNKRPRPSMPSDIAGPSTPAPPLPPQENPYLAHLPPHLRGMSTNGVATGANGVNGTGKVSSPLNGLVPRRVTVDQAKAIMVSLGTC